MKSRLTNLLTNWISLPPVSLSTATTQSNETSASWATCVMRSRSTN